MKNTKAGLLRQDRISRPLTVKNFHHATLVLAFYMEAERSGVQMFTQTSS